MLGTAAFSFVFRNSMGGTKPWEDVGLLFWNMNYFVNH